MSSYLKKPPLRRNINVVKGDKLPEGQPREMHVTQPLASNIEVPEKSDEERRVEVPSDKVLAAKEKKKEQAAKLGLKKPPSKRSGGNISSRVQKRSRLSVDDDVIDLDSAEGISNPEPIHSVFPKDVSSGQSGGSETGILIEMAFLFVSNCTLSCMCCLFINKGFYF